ncbi:hypothetical protein I3760_08G111500 [Carya illinoinensis]|nr:hypothetical protein I3760_08G111500 [Carya illinoinensis]
MAKLSSLLYIVFFVLCVITHYSSNTVTVYNVISFGAKANGIGDSTPAFINAWAAASCASTGSTAIKVPKGRYVLGSSAFKGECKSFDITFQIEGTLVAPADYGVLGKAKIWLSFEGVSHVTIVGGALDAKGQSLWACKLAASKNFPSGATTLSFTDSNNIRIKGLLSQNSQMFHIVLKIIAAGDSPNTDGIHVQLSSNVAITKSRIRTGDDCISIGPGTKDLWIERVECGPGHGISIGMKKAVFTGTQNGFRIKSWARPSNGFVQRVRFLGAVMNNVQNPILIDQNYCPTTSTALLRNEDSHFSSVTFQKWKTVERRLLEKVSGIKISDVIYRGIRGTSATQTAIKFYCSSKKTCTGIRLENVNLTCLDQVAQSSCTNAIGRTLGSIQPNGCL